ncbi:MAG: type II toxin-antitoxin system RelB family antitoxin [Vagococcus fluvialis]|jgi:hypothetical protein
MVTVSLKMTEQDRTFLKAMAKFEGLTLSELIRSKTLSALEDEYDARIADQSLIEYENYLNNGGKEQDINELWSELNL